MDKFKSDFIKFWDLIDKKENFAFVRYGDGELMLMNGNAVGTNTQAYQVDKWASPNHLTKLGIDLAVTLEHYESNYYYGIPAPTDNVEIYNNFKNVIKCNEENLTFANLLINANYVDMKERLYQIKREVILICNEHAKIENFPFNVIEFTPFPNDCVNFWESNGEVFKNNILEKYGNYNDKLFIISCGPASEIIIDMLYKNNPNNTYVDVGSAIDEFVHGYQTRPYMKPQTQYANMVSKF